MIEGGGHLPQARDPVKVNLLIRDFVRRVAPARRPPLHNDVAARAFELELV